MNRLGFVIPFVSREFSSNWELHLDLLQATLKSIFNQSDPNFICYVVAFDDIVLDIVDDRLRLIKYPYQRLNIDLLTGYSKENTIDVDHVERNYDIGKKALYGCQFAIADKCTHVMKVDADDLVSNRVCSFIKTAPSENSYFIRQGYVMKRHSNFLYKENKLDSINGSTNIVSIKYLPKNDFESNDIRDFDYFTNHYHLKIRLRKFFNAMVLPLPFKGVIYIKHQIGVSGTTHLFERTSLVGLAKFVLRGVWINESIRKEFSIEA